MALDPYHDVISASINDMVTGNLLPNCSSVSDELAERGISSSLYSFHTVKPLDKECLEEIFAGHEYVITVEEHGRLGGFGSAVAEWLASQKQPRARLLTLGTPDQFLLYTGNQEEARKKCGLDKAGLLEQITDFIGPT